MIPDRLQSGMDSGTILHGLRMIRGFPRISLQFFRIPGNPLRFYNLLAIQLDCTGSRTDCLESIIQSQSPGLRKIVKAIPGFWLDRVVMPDRLQSDVNYGTTWRGLRADCGFPRTASQVFLFPGNPSRFYNLVAIQLDCTGSRTDCLESVIQPQSPVLQKIVSALSGFWQSMRNSI